MGHWLSSTAVALSALAGPALADMSFGDLTRAAIRGEAGQVEAILQWGGGPNREGWLGLSPLAAAMRSCSVTPEVV